MNYTLIINQILTLFIIILVGYILKKKDYIDKKIEKGLSKLLINVVLPALIISSMIIEINDNLINNVKLISIISVTAYLFLIIFSSLIVKLFNIEKDKKIVFRFMLIFSNVGYMGYPVIDAIYPEYGIFYAVFNNIAFNFILWTYGVYMFTADNKGLNIKWKNILNNGLIASFIGLIFMFTSYKPPVAIRGALESLGNMTFPLSMLIIGASLAKVKFTTIFRDKYLFILALLRLISIPIITFFILKPFSLPEIINNIAIILVAMPSAANTVILAEEFDGNSTFASEGVFFTTLFSLFTIPLILLFIT